MRSSSLIAILAVLWVAIPYPANAWPWSDYRDEVRLWVNSLGKMDGPPTPQAPRVTTDLRQLSGGQGKGYCQDTLSDDTGSLTSMVAFDPNAGIFSRAPLLKLPH